MSAGKRLYKLSQIEALWALADRLGISPFLWSAIVIVAGAAWTFLLWAYSELPLWAVLLIAPFLMWAAAGIVNALLGAFLKWKTAKSLTPVDREELASDAERLASEIVAIDAAYRERILAAEHAEHFKETRDPATGRLIAFDRSESARLRAEKESEMARNRIQLRCFDVVNRAKKHLSLESNHLWMMAKASYWRGDEWPSYLMEIVGQLRYSGDDVPGFNSIPERQAGTYDGTRIRDGNQINA